MKSTENDIHSFAQPEEARATHLHWTANVDFETKTIAAVASWSIEKKADADVIIFDTKGLNIEKITLDNDAPTTFKLTEYDSLLGQGLAVLIQSNTKQVNIYYQTSPEAEAIQWLKPQQTAGKKFPFLFTQSQAILARSWVPCQDSPGMRFTYDADVTVPKDLLPLMSASNPMTKNAEGVYHFEMKQPIPSYLLALSVGDLSFAPISERSGIYAEPSILDTAAWEFADLEKMIAGAESLSGAYPWERYDVLVLPPSFPFGGMENPRLTFATPTILAGDRSLTSLIAHELAHSWSGNLVTNATWNDFWLNEGFTVYFETRIMEKLYGRDYAEMLASLNLQDLKDEVKSLTTDGHAADTKLKLNLEGRNPDDGVTEIAYIKGYYFLRSIEEQHGREYFDKFVKDYFTQNAFKAMTTESFIPFIKDYYKKQFNVTLEDTFFKTWIFTEGLPADCPTPASTKFDEVDTVMTNWTKTQKLESTITKNWSTHEWLHFLKNLPNTLSLQQMKTLDNTGNFTASGNAEIITVWGTLAVQHQYKAAYPNIEIFLINTGRRKFLMPLYGEMIKTEDGKRRALAIYEKARPNYHFVTVNSLDKLLK
ncbi:MAG TPA: M1 family metallopeptidase [Chryseolinea sp.]|nr:M1 family metallopeptidase [Chryseolinea sp.]